MAGPFIARYNELNLLRKVIDINEPKIVLIYGRRRIGKTRLIEEALKNSKSLYFEGLEQQNQAGQISNFVFQLQQQTDFKVPKKTELKTWSSVLVLLNEYLKLNPGTTVVLDELQWMAANRSSLIAELKMVWERYWSKSKGSKLILCGSNASFMVKRVLESKALYGRIDKVIELQTLTLSEAQEFFPGRGFTEIELAYLILGGVPKYFELIAQDTALLQGIAREYFSSSGYLRTEFKRIFVSHFGASDIYEKIVRALSGKHFGLSRGELIKRQISGGGGQLTKELYDLEKAGFINSFTPFDKPGDSKFKRYRLIDPFIYFYLTFIEAQENKRELKPSDFINHIFPSAKFKSWLGQAYELMLLKHQHNLANVLGFSGIEYKVGAYFRHAKSGVLSGVQLDLVFDRADKVITVCEAKYCAQPVSLSVGQELDRKIAAVQAFEKRTVQRVIVSNQPASTELVRSGLVGRVISTEELVRSAPLK